MIPVLFKEDEQVFTHNGIGALYESLSCDVIEEENGAFTMELEYPVDGEWFSEIKDFRIIQAKPNDIDDPHNFRIYEIEKSIDELTVFVRANTQTNDLGNNLITNYVGKNVTPQQAMNGIKNNLIEGTNFDLISDIQTRSNVEWTRINPLNAIVGVRGSLVDIWGGQLKRTNTAIYLYSRRGRDNVVTIRPGKNIEGLKMTVSTAGLVTKILPTFSYRPVDVPKYQMVTNSDGTKEKRRVQTSGSTTLRDDITVLGTTVSSQYIDNYPIKYWSSVDYGDDDELKNTVDEYIDTRLTYAEESPGIVDMSGFDQELKDFVKTELDKRAAQYFTHRNPGVDKPTVRITVNMLQLADSPDWEEFKDLERIGLTDTLNVWVEKYDIDVEVRVTGLTYDSIGERVKGFNAGSDRAPRQSAIEKKYDDLTKATNDYITSFKNGVQNILRNTADGLNRKFEGYTEPPAELSSEGDIWFKEIGEGKVEIWIHDGTYWQPLMTEDFGKKLEADMVEQKKEIDAAKAAADEAVDRINNEIADKFTTIDFDISAIEAISNTAKTNAQTALNQSLEALGDANTALTNAQTALNRADTAIGSASNAATLAGNALTKADEAQDAATILSGQVSGFETTVSGFNQTVNNYEGQVSGFRNDILGLESTVANYATEVDEFGNAVSTYATEVNTMRNTVSGFESTVATYGTEVSDLAGEVLGYKNQVSTFNNTVSGFNSTVANYTTEVNELGEEVESYATEVSTLTNTVSGFQSKVTKVEKDYAGISGTVATHSTSISNLDGQIALKANTTTVNELTGRVSTAETSITANANAIKLKANNTTVNTLTGRVSTAETGITANATAIGLKASQSSVDTLSGTVNTLSGQVDVTAGQISSKVWNTDIQTAVDGIEIGGRNYANYELVGAYVGGNVIPRISVTEVEDYKYSTNGHPRDIMGFVSYPLPKGKITVSAKSDSPYFNPYYSLKRIDGSTVRGQTTRGRMELIDGFFKLTIENPENDSILYIGLGPFPFVDDYVVWNVKIEKGNKATDWTPAPEDTTALIDHVESELTQKYDSITASVSSIDGRVATNTLDLEGLTTTVQDVRKDLTGTSTLLNTTRTTVNGHTSTIATLRTDVDGKATTAQFNTLNSTVNGTIQRVGNAEGKITTIETNVSGLQTTVTSKASQTQVTQLSNLLSSTVSDVEDNATQITQNSTNINLRVKKGDVVSQLNIDANRTLISSSKILLNANTVSISGTAWMDGAVIANASIDGAKIADATIASAKIASLDASKISTGTLDGIEITGVTIRGSTFIQENPSAGSTYGRWDRTGITLQDATGTMIMDMNREGINFHGSGVTHKGTYINNDLIDVQNANIFNLNVTGEPARMKRALFDGNITVGSSVSGNNAGIIFNGKNPPTAYDRMIWAGFGSRGDGLYTYFDGWKKLQTEITNTSDIAMNTLTVNTLNINNVLVLSNRLALRNTGLQFSGGTIPIPVDRQMWVGYGYADNGIYVSMGENWYKHGATISDERLKKNIVETTTDSLTAIKSWEFVEFEWKDSGYGSGQQFGLIAQNTNHIANYYDEVDRWEIDTQKQTMMNSHAIQQLAIRELNTNAVASQALQLGETNEEKIRRLEKRIEELESVL